MIRSFADRTTERFFRDGICPARWRTFQAVAARKLDMVDAATRPDDLRSPPGNRLELLKGNRNGQYSIRPSPNRPISAPSRAWFWSKFVPNKWCW